MIKILYHPLSPLVIFAVVLSTIFSIYLLAGMSPSPTFEVVATFCSGFLLIYWMVADARQRGQVPCFDFGFLCYILFPLTLPWYCFWSRGWRGVLMLLLLVAIFLTPYVVSTVVWIALYG